MVLVNLKTKWLKNDHKQPDENTDGKYYLPFIDGVWERLLKIRL